MNARDSDARAPLRVGLTGGIASGKSTVADLFAAMGVEVIDADLIAHELTAPGKPLLVPIARHFGEDILDNTGNLDRKKLRDLVFSSPPRREALEALLHPAILAEMDVRASRSEGPYVLLVIPLLAETGAVKHLDRILVVDCDESEQLARLMARDSVSETSARQILRAQASRDERLRLADDVLFNQVPREDLEGLVLKLHRMYRSLDGPGDARTRPGLRLP